MELQIPYSICPQVQKVGNLRTDKERYWENTQAAVRSKESGNHRGRSMSGSYTHAGEYTAPFERSAVHGIFEREKLANDI